MLLSSRRAKGRLRNCGLPVLDDLYDPRRRLRAKRREHLRRRRHFSRREMTIERVSTLPKSDQMHDLSFAPQQTRDDGLRPAGTVRTKHAHELVSLLRCEPQLLHNRDHTDSKISTTSAAGRPSSAAVTTAVEHRLGRKPSACLDGCGSSSCS